MKEKLKPLAAAAVICLICSCATTPPPTLSEPIQGSDPFRIIVPKDLDGNSGPLKGVQLRPFQNRTGELEFFSVQFSNNRESEQHITSVCRGDLHTTGSRYESCVHIDSTVSIRETEETYEVKITPHMRRTAQGRNALYLPIRLPDVEIDRWHAWISNQSVALQLQATSQFGPESIKANFDRTLQRYHWHGGQADAAHRQFHETYSMEIGHGMSALISASFYPYRDGTLVEFLVQGRSTTQNGVNSRDWAKGLEPVRAQVERIMAD